MSFVGQHGCFITCAEEGLRAFQSGNGRQCVSGQLARVTIRFDGNTWMHVAATYDGATIRLYINGIEESSLAASFTIAANDLPLSIGAQSNADRFFQGALDQVRVYNRALSADEVAGLVGGSLPPTGLTCTDILPKTATISTEWKPQSKVWRYAGAWWSVFPTAAGADGASSAGTWLWKLVGNQWTEVLKLSTRTDTKADVKVAGNVIHALLYNDPNTQLASAQYNAGTGFYEAWSQWPGLSSINLPNSEVATIDIDSTGRMWLATRDQSIPGNARIVAYYSDSPYSNWTNPPSRLGPGSWRATTYRSSPRCPARPARSASSGRIKTPSGSGSRRMLTGLPPATGRPTKCPRPSRRSTAWGRAWRTTT